MSRDLNQLIENDYVLSQAMRSMSRAASPPGMTTSLRVLASRERARMLRQRNLASRVLAWRDRAHLLLENIMRPFAVPLAGGVFSTLALFSMWVAPMYPVLAHSGGADVPTVLTTLAQVKDLAQVGMGQADVVVDIYLDDRGNMVDYKVISGGNLMLKESRRNLENLLVFTRYIPATSFGKPMPAKMRMGFINLKG
ncbi:MAG: hypothetical protein ABI811_08635 [Acidobacteriota bacterium]